VQEVGVTVIIVIVILVVVVGMISGIVGVGPVVVVVVVVIVVLISVGVELVGVIVVVDVVVGVGSCIQAQPLLKTPPCGLPRFVYQELPKGVLIPHEKPRLERLTSPGVSP